VGIYHYIFKKKYRASLGARFGKGFPVIEKRGQRLVWIHAVSVGETKAIAALAKLIKINNPEMLMVVSSVTETAHAEAKRSLPFADHHVYLPLDFGWVIRPIVQRTAPDLVILCETDFWFNFLRFAKKGGARIMVANGKLSDVTCERLKRFPRFSQHLFGLIDLFCVQAEVYKKRFEAVSVPPEKIVVTGNLKFDEEYPRLSELELTQWRQKLGVGADDRVLVVGSSHDPEEKLFLQVMERVWQSHPHLKMILVPRHPERFNQVATLLQERHVPFIRYSTLEKADANAKVILIDAMGLLRHCYQLADLAIVAGSYTSRVGGHNILEPSWYGVPVIHGPYMHAQPELVSLTKEYGTAKQVEAAQLAQTIEQLLATEQARSGYRHGAAALLRNCSGACARTWKAMNL
jgi:3-deoxy-D-manno-octulosonic-acid transferase